MFFDGVECVLPDIATQPGTAFDESGGYCADAVRCGVAAVQSAAVAM
jgi:hypothetical protein